MASITLVDPTTQPRRNRTTAWPWRPVRHVVQLVFMGLLFALPLLNWFRIDLRGRYMAIYDLGWAIPSMLGPAAAGLILDNYDPNLVWYTGGLLCAVSAVSFYFLHLWLGRQTRFVPVEANIPPAA